MQKRITKKGFTIMETLVAVAILAIGITGPITIVYSSIQSANIAQDQVAAYYFAQEGVEFIRYVRDTNIINGAGWLDNLNLCVGSPCKIDDILKLVSDPGNIVQNCGGNCSAITYDGTKYDDTGGTDTKFFRDIVIDDTVGITQEVEIVVTITWETRTKPYTFELRERIFDWSGGS